MIAVTAALGSASSWRSAEVSRRLALCPYSMARIDSSERLPSLVWRRMESRMNSTTIRKPMMMSTHASHVPMTTIFSLVVSANTIMSAAGTTNPAISAPSSSRG